MAKRLLILGGTSDAAAIARRASERFGSPLEIISSLAGTLKSPPSLPGAIRIGGFGGSQGLANYLASEHVDWVIDATHPFAAEISGHCAAACRTTGTPWVMLVRPRWMKTEGDLWIEVPDFDSAAGMTLKTEQRIFLAIGTGALSAFAKATSSWFLVRLFQLSDKPLPLSSHVVVVARPPFTVEREIRLLQAFGVNTLVVKQSGGPTSAKLTAARLLGLPVIIVQRPEMPKAQTVSTVEEAMTWLVDSF